MKRRGYAILMIIAILAITGFQVYWMKNNYDRERQSLDIKTNAAFRQTILKLQASKLKLERISMRFDSAAPASLTTTIATNKSFPVRTKFTSPVRLKEPPITLLNLLQEKMKDSLKRDSNRSGTIIISMKNDTLRRLFIDSLKGLKTTKRTISLSSPDSLTHAPQVV